MGPGRWEDRRRERGARRLKLAVAAIAVALSSACAPLPDGAETPSERHSTAGQCCAPGDRAMCATATPVPVGTACVCRGADRNGPFVVQGSACRPG